MATSLRTATVVVIGAGQAGLSAAFHLQRLGYDSALDDDAEDPTFVVLDANPAPGGAWQHRWESLTMNTVNGIFDLPGMEKPPIDEAEPSKTAVPHYFADYESTFNLPIMRPVRVVSVNRADAAPDGDLVVETTGETWRTRAIINATGTWDNPRLPAMPGAETFRGRQLHTRDYVSLDEFAGQRVAIVGGGISAIQHIEEISRVATTLWYTRREPVWLDGSFRPETEGRATIAAVKADVEAGRPSGSIVSYTGLPWTSYALEAKARGALDRRPMFTALEPHGVREADGSLTTVDTVLWATGFAASLAHLDPLRLRHELGGIVTRSTRVVDEPRVHLVGFGPSQSTLGANRDGRHAATEIDRMLGRDGRPARARSRAASGVVA